MFELVVVVASKTEPEQKANFGEIRVILCHRYLLPYNSPFPYLLLLNPNPGLVRESQQLILLKYPAQDTLHRGLVAARCPHQKHQSTNNATTTTTTTKTVLVLLMASRNQPKVFEETTLVSILPGLSSYEDSACPHMRTILLKSYLRRPQ